MAIAIPYSGILAKVCSEMIDEATARVGLRPARGRRVPASGLRLWFAPARLSGHVRVRLLSFRMRAPLVGDPWFLWFPHPRLLVPASFENLHYGEVWTYLTSCPRSSS